MKIMLHYSFPSVKFIAPILYLYFSKFHTNKKKQEKNTKKIINQQGLQKIAAASQRLDGNLNAHIIFNKL